MACPLCNEKEARPSWLGSTVYDGREFPYVECLACRSLYCDPMPDDATLARMYGTDYATGCEADPVVEDPKEPRRVVDRLASLPPGVFLDYGCGGGALLEEAARLRWRAVGVELDAEVARQVSERTGLEVLTASAALDRDPIADVLHLGDVIEHLTKAESQMPEILRLLKPGGLLIAQGPLEGNANLFTLALRLARTLRRRRGAPSTEMAPYHVMLATAGGQRTFFRRFGLEEIEYRLSEVSWPAPDRLTRSGLRRPREVGLYTLRRLSQAATALRPHAWGNRYFYVGRR
ncbi:MAG TPA: class I SAM-dependent methyltransferase [Pyrinomonadaceae bacterium]|jgi:SAM-dependent methyltransferase|nr:class I SAM-dependent methyltransferase [Pyrinomonadaceae bacterium]